MIREILRRIHAKEGNIIKIGILTASRTNNNGTDLQALAMQMMLNTIGVDAEIIDYKCKKLERSHKICPHLSTRDILKIPLRIFNNYTHYNFRKNNFKLSDKSYTEKNISKIEYDIIIVGSDQIWNLDITGYDINFFLPFDMKQAKKYSYAASLGKTDLQIIEDNYSISNYLKDFQGVSVREKSGVKALAEIGIQARHDLDPILMVDNKHWLKIIDKHYKKKKPYVLLYLVEHNAEIISRTKKFAKKHNLDVLMISQTLKIIEGVTIKRFVSIEKWITYMSNAELIITNSYHGLSFAIALEKSFRLVKLNKIIQRNTRMMGLLNDLGLEEFVADRMEFLGMTKPNWRKVNVLLSKRRLESSSYLSTIFSKIIAERISDRCTR
ncbi:polysaccharide pyruvyl transferase family protein [Natronospora cellulosivora (SeqCode)]